MASPIFLHELPMEQLQQISPEDIHQTLKSEQLYFQYPSKKMYYLAVNRSNKASAIQEKINDLPIAHARDGVIYANSMITKIISEVGEVCIIEDRVAALFSNQLDNDNEIIESPNHTVTVNFFKGGKLPEGFLSLEGVNHG